MAEDEHVMQETAGEEEGWKYEEEAVVVIVVKQVSVVGPDDVPTAASLSISS